MKFVFNIRVFWSICWNSSAEGTCYGSGGHHTHLDFVCVCHTDPLCVSCVLYMTHRPSQGVCGVTTPSPHTASIWSVWVVTGGDTECEPIAERVLVRGCVG